MRGTLPSCDIKALVTLIGNGTPVLRNRICNLHVERFINLLSRKYNNIYRLNWIVISFPRRNTCDRYFNNGKN